MQKGIAIEKQRRKTREKHKKHKKHKGRNKNQKDPLTFLYRLVMINQKLVVANRKERSLADDIA